LDEKCSFFHFFFDRVDAAIKIYIYEHAPQFSWPNGVFVVLQFLRIYKLPRNDNLKGEKIPLASNFARGRSIQRYHSILPLTSYPVKPRHQASPHNNKTVKIVFWWNALTFNVMLTLCWRKRSSDVTFFVVPVFHHQCCCPLLGCRSRPLLFYKGNVAVIMQYKLYAFGWNGHVFYVNVRTPTTSNRLDSVLPGSKDTTRPTCVFGNWHIFKLCCFCYRTPRLWLSHNVGDLSETITESVRVVAGRLRFSRRSPETTRRH